MAHTLLKVTHRLTNAETSHLYNLAVYRPSAMYRSHLVS